ncbi:MAG: DUF853 family protein [Candidatus Aenigmarchaeota archaeon]|nr:DUF853 family protein [Candidatus Aenigmarchaeota archaeon]
MYEIIVGRNSDDLKKYGSIGTAYIGKHVVGTGEDAHTTSKILLDLIRPHVMLVCGKRGSGKCLHGDTLITLSDGSVAPIKDLANDTRSVLGLNNDLKIGVLQKTEFFKRRVDKLVKIRLRSGKEIRLTPEHPLLTIKGWKQVNELSIGSRVATPRTLDCFGNKELEDYKTKLLAYLIAEGHLGNGFVLFSNSDPEMMSEFKSCVEEFVLSNPVRNEFGQFSKGNYGANTKSSITKWLIGLGLYDKRSAGKFIPDCVFNLPRNQLSLFLNRLFSCDGSLYNKKGRNRTQWEISYSSRSEILIRQVQHLLLRFGVLSRIRPKITKINGKRIPSFEIVVGSESVTTFIKRIGFFGEKKGLQKVYTANEHVIKRNPNTDTIPEGIWDIYRPKNWAELGRKMGYSMGKALRTSINYSPSRQKLLQMAEAEQNENLALLAKSDIFWDEIIMMEELEGSFDVFDISVPEFHNFVANEIIVHNSYSAGVIAEEMAALPKELRDNLAFIIIDPMGIYWSMKNPNEKDSDLLRKWDLKQKGVDISLFVPGSKIAEYESAGILWDHTISLPAGEFTAEDWAITFNIEMFSDAGVLLGRAIKNLKEKSTAYGVKDIINEIDSDKRADQKHKDVLRSLFENIDSWGIFSKEKISLEEMFKPGSISVIDISHYEGWAIKNLFVSLISKKIYQARLLSRKEEEAKSIAGEEKSGMPMVWLMIDESHQFLPNDAKTTSTEALLTLVKLGREPGISTVFITQQPYKLHPDALSQTDVVLSHRLTSEQDVKALETVMQTYLLNNIQKSIDDLPKWKGTAIILDDNSEKLYSLVVRPRTSWHAGGSPIAIKNDQGTRNN